MKTIKRRVKRTIARFVLRTITADVQCPACKRYTYVRDTYVRHDRRFMTCDACHNTIAAGLRTERQQRWHDKIVADGMFYQLIRTADEWR